MRPLYKLKLILYVWLDLSNSTISEILKLQYEYIEELVGMPISPRRKQASVLWLLTTRNAIHTYLKDGIKDEFDNVITL